MSRARYADVIVDPGGVPVAGATVDVYDTGTTTPISGTIYAAPTGGSTLPNPIVANDQGEIEFWLEAPIRVDLKYTRPGYVTETHTVEVLAAEHEHSGTYVPADPTLVLTYNADGTLASVAETHGGSTITTTFTYNADGTLATSTRLAVTRNYTYTNGVLTGVA